MDVTGSGQNHNVTNPWSGHWPRVYNNMSTQGTSICDDCREAIPAKAKFCPECGVTFKRPYIKLKGKRGHLYCRCSIDRTGNVAFTEAACPAQARSDIDVQVTIGDGSMPGTQPVKPTALSEDVSHKLTLV